MIYHKADYDGIFCREIARKFLPNAELIGWDYGDPTPPIQEDVVLYMLDISVPELMNHPNLIWIDHHKSAIEKYGTKPGYQIDGVAACRLAWQWFNRTSDGSTGYAVNVPSTKEPYVERRVTEPLAVRLAGEYDIWDKRDPQAELLQHGLRSQELNKNCWDLLLTNHAETDTQHDVGTELVYALLDQGKCLQYAKTKENESIIKSAGFTLRFEELTFLACNHARYNSFLFTAGLKPEHDACLGFCWRAGKWTVSLYHAPGKEHFDLSLTAVKYGGGGHRGACGFTCKELPFQLA